MLSCWHFRGAEQLRFSVGWGGSSDRNVSTWLTAQLLIFSVLLHHVLAVRPARGCRACLKQGLWVVRGQGCVCWALCAGTACISKQPYRGHASGTFLVQGMGHDLLRHGICLLLSYSSSSSQWHEGLCMRGMCQREFLARVYTTEEVISHTLCYMFGTHSRHCDIFHMYFFERHEAFCIHQQVHVTFFICFRDKVCIWT